METNKLLSEIRFKTEEKHEELTKEEAINLISKIYDDHINIKEIEKHAEAAHDSLSYILYTLLSNEQIDQMLPSEKYDHEPRSATLHRAMETISYLTTIEDYMEFLNPLDKYDQEDE